MSGLFKKRNRKNIRSRKTEDEEEQDGGDEVIMKPKPVPVSHGILSFQDELNEDVGFKIKKSSQSERFVREREREMRQEEKERRRKEEEEVVRKMEEEEEEDDEDVSISAQLHAGMVPDATMIHAIRKKRELARNLGVESVDYLPLEKGGKKGYGKASGKSRLIREDEHDLSDEEEESVLKFGRSNEPERQMQVLTALENVASDSEDEETRRWEEEQINKGINASNQTQDTTPVENTISSLDPITQSFIYGSTQFEPDYQTPYEEQYQESYSSSVSKKPNVHFPEKLVPITLETLKSRLANQLRDIEEDHSHHTQQLNQVENDLTTAEQEIIKMETNYPSLEQKYAFFQQMRGYLRDLLSCLAIKAPQIKILEVKVREIQQKKSSFLIDRRRQDVKDEAVECLGVVKAIQIGPEVEARQRRSVEREARRRRRREKRSREGIKEHDEGMSSDDEVSESRKLEFVTETNKVNDKLKEVFTNVVDDFYRLSVIKTRFEQWKFSHEETYLQAYVPLCLPKLFTPYVIYQMIHWNPLDINSTPFECMKWFEILLFYGYQENEDPDPEDEDTQLIPQLFDRAILPKITEIIEYVWDPLSRSQTQHLVNVVSIILKEYSIKQTQHQDELVTTIRKRLQESVNVDVFIPLMSATQLQNTNTREYLFYQRQFWSAIKLVGNIVLWKTILPNAVLQQLALDGVLNRYIILSLQNSPTNHITVRKLETLVSMLPEDWSIQTCTSLQGLQRYIMNLLETLKREAMGYPDHLKKSYKILEDRVKEIQLRIEK